MQERRNFIVNALELHLSCTNPSICASLNWVIIGLDNDMSPVGTSHYLNLFPWDQITLNIIVYNFAAIHPGGDELKNKTTWVLLTCM